MSLGIPESLRRKIQGVRICLECDDAQCEELKGLSNKRYQDPVRGECSFCHQKETILEGEGDDQKRIERPRLLVWCRCDLRLCPDGCGCSMAVHIYGSKTRTLWCSKQKCWGFKHKTVLVVEPQETKIQAIPVEMENDAIEPENLPEDYKMKAANDL